MKKIFIIMTMAVMMLTTQVMATDVIIDGVPVAFNDNSGHPFIENSRTLVPLRATMEAYGAEVDWDGAQNMAIVRKGSTTVCCRIGENCIYRNGTRIENDAAAVIRNGRTYLPIRAVLEALDAREVAWNGNVIVTSDGAGSLINNIENSGLHVSNLWKRWEEALSEKNNGNYSIAIEKLKQLAPDFIAANDGNSRAMLYKHLGECYSSLKMNKEAKECFKREAYFWESAGKEQERIDANRRSTLIDSTVEIFAKTYNEKYKMRTDFGENYEPVNGVYLGAYAEGDSAVHNAWSMDKFYMNEFPKLIGKDVAGYLLYLPSNVPLSNYQSHIDKAIEKNKIIQIALEPTSLYDINEYSQDYIKLAQDMEKSKAKFILRFASEMNDTTCPWYTTDYELYKKKFRIVANIFHTYAPSVPIVWSPNFYPADTMSLYYPGDEYVDYVGISAYMNHQPETDPLGKNIDRNRFGELIDKIYSLYGYKKPIIVSEGGASYMDYNTGADITDFSSRQLFDFYTYLPIKYPNVKAVFIFDNDTGRYRYSLSNNQAYLDAYKRGISNSTYLSSIDDSSNGNIPQYYEIGANVIVEAGNVELSSFVKTPENDISYVVYRVNGADIATAYAIPYSINYDFSTYRGQTVNIGVIAFNSKGEPVAEKSYRVKIEN